MMSNPNPYGSTDSKIPEFADSADHRTGPTEPQSFFATALTIFAVGVVGLSMLAILLVLAGLMIEVFFGIMI